MASTFGGWRSIQLSYGCIDSQIVPEIEQGQSRNRVMETTDSQQVSVLPIVAFRSLRPPSICFRGASVASKAVLLLPSSFPNLLVSLAFFDTLTHQKELASAFGGQRSIQLSYGCMRRGP